MIYLKLIFLLTNIYSLWYDWLVGVNHIFFAKFIKESKVKYE